MSGVSGQQFQNADPFASLRGLGVDQNKAAGATHNVVSPAVARARRLRRPADLVQAITRIDAQTDPVAITQWLGWIAANYEVSDCGLLLGLFSHCYLGDPYVDHLLDMNQNILHHYAPADVVPAGFEVARPLARTETYAFIEVYTDGTVIPIYSDGRPG